MTDEQPGMDIHDEDPRQAARRKNYKQEQVLASPNFGQVLASWERVTQLTTEKSE